MLSLETISARSAAAAATVFAVVVAYERRIDDVPAWPYLLERLKARDQGETPCVSAFVLHRVLIYDNSATPCACPPLDLAGAIYVHDPSNGGTAAAYSRACREAADCGSDWLLLLDHDTSLPTGFIEAAAAAHAQQRLWPACALLPWVLHNGEVVSPARVTPSGAVVPLRKRWPVTADQALTGISSGSLIRVDALAELLPFPSSLWLDYVDHWIFMQLRQHGARLAVFDATLQHDLSVSDIRTLSTRRLTSILDGEATYVALLGMRARLVHPLRLMARALRYAFQRPELAKHLLIWVSRRLRRTA